MVVQPLAAVGHPARDVRFPSDFGWCVATAAHQIEGNDINSDHYLWETAAVNRVLTNDLVSNPSLNVADPGLSFSITHNACPKFDSKHDPDPSRAHSKIFEYSVGREKRICEISGKSIDHWTLFAKDIALMKDLGLHEYRMSVEWAKIEPRKGEFDRNVLAHYANEIRQLKASGIEAQVTLFHFVMPQWLRAEGGWENPESAYYFERFTKKVYAAFGPSVRTWYTLNEPMVHVVSGYIGGVLPPGKRDLLMIPRVLTNLLRAHALAYHVIHNEAAKNATQTPGHLPVRVGVAHHLRVFDPKTEAPRWTQPLKMIKFEAERLAAFVSDYVWNWMFFDAIETGKFTIGFSELSLLARRFNLEPPAYLDFAPIDIENLRGTQDFLGINYYTRDMIEFDLAHYFNGRFYLRSVYKVGVNAVAKDNGETNDMGWEIYPQGLYRLLKAIDARGMRNATNRRRDIIISENGIADRYDIKREKFLRDHLRAVSHAIDEGIPVAGYCHWTLIDNFEWNSGYFPKFGLYSVDLKTQVRRQRKSGQWYQETIKKNGWQE